MTDMLGKLLLQLLPLSFCVIPTGILTLLPLYLLWLTVKIVTRRTVKVAELTTRRPEDLVELKGVVRCATPLISPVTGTPCVYYTGRYGTKAIPFELEDETGSVRVDPEGAEIEGKVDDRGLATLDKQGRVRAVPVGARVYVLGLLREDGTVGAPKGNTRLDFLISVDEEWWIVMRHVVYILLSGLFAYASIVITADVLHGTISMLRHLT